jgi:hypothetical protein
MMDLISFFDRLGYSDSPHFLRRGSAELRTAPDFGHIFRKATPKPCHLEGVYTLRRTPESKIEPLVPVVYVCSAESDEAADKVHELVWNQDVVPFILVHSRRGVSLYSGFRCQPLKNGLERGILRALTQFSEVSELVESFNADAIDSGKLWRDWGEHVTPETRIDWKLLANLRNLDSWLRETGGLKKEVSHALIGKYVYLHYLRDRDILSNARLAEWKLDECAIFGGTATRAGLEAVTKRLDDWLNGSVFPLKLRGRDAPDDELISRVAATFHGDEIVGERDWQLHLDFRVYNFSYIPIETLSVIYEQFLHMPAENGETTKGKEAAAYYTPIPVVNFMLSEMDERLPLKRGMKVFDPACGSGAFLVQSYRRLIEREFPATKKRPTPQELRSLLEEHFFGVDNDADACLVTELSLILTLLDYCDPPDLLPRSPLQSDSDFKLPALSGTNIFQTNFFKLKNDAKQTLADIQFDWIVGNPPWKGLDPAKLIKQDKPVWAWMIMAENKKSRPCGDNEVAQAFAWRAIDFLSDAGTAALLVPAMALFEDPSRRFRAKFFSTHRVTAIANFSNLAEVLFAGRSRVPAAALFFDRHRIQTDLADEQITVFSPLIANQEVTRPSSSHERITTWSLVVTANEIRDIPLQQVVSGDALPWKLAAWGSKSDAKLLRRLATNLPSFRELESKKLIKAAEGPALVSKERKTGPKRTRYISDVVGKKTIDFRALKRLRHLFEFPASAMKINDKHYLELRGNQIGLALCPGPHVIVSAARNFAIYSNEYLVVPRRQIGVRSETDDNAFLKALSLFLSSDFAFYHQFLTAPQFGVKRDVATLRALRSMPVPIANYSAVELRPWVRLHSRLVKTTPIDVRETRVDGRKGHQTHFQFDGPDREDISSLVTELNDLVYDSLGFDELDRALVHDLVRVRLHLIDGNIGRPAIRPPKPTEMRAYARRLRYELDAFIGAERDKRNQIGIVYDRHSGMIQIDLISDHGDARNLRVISADQATGGELEETRLRLRKKQSQWVYFDRNLRVYEGSKTFVFKPMQRFHWTESQALLDAGEIIAGTLQLGDQDQ